MAALSDAQRKERLSVSWLAAMASVAGLACDEPKSDTDSIDLTLSARGPLRPKLDVQMKATTNADIRDGDLSFRLSRKNYDDLRARRTVPLILVVVELPKQDSEWMDFRTEELLLRRRAWWASLRGAEEISTETRTVVVPRRMDVNVLIDLMVQVRERRLP